MKRVVGLCAVLAVGIVLGRLFDGKPPRAEAGGVDTLPRCQDINGDGRSDVSDAVFFLNWLFLGGPEPVCQSGNGESAGLPDTGQTICYDQDGAEIPCDSATCRGQDGFYRTGCPSEGRFADNGDGTVTDACTGLVWQRDTGNDGMPVDWCAALAYCEDLELADHDDWRLPNVRELQSLVDYGRWAPAIASAFNVQPVEPNNEGVEGWFYWSSSMASNPAESGDAWAVDFSEGLLDDGSVPRGDRYFVRAVRSRQ